mmetsp:Transcript_34284/g.70102  ORF Transcript_34284/g.70102 Transcript_34284/m.70102 type:complete len:294 (+) Transcript_34284:1688-2569(+)
MVATSRVEDVQIGDLQRAAAIEFLPQRGVTRIQCVKVTLNAVLSIGDGCHVMPAHGLAEVEAMQHATRALRMVTHGRVGEKECSSRRRPHEGHEARMRFRDVGGHRDAVAAVPAIGLDPAEGTKSAGLSTIAGVVHVDSLNVPLPRAIAFKEVHDVGLHRLRSIDQALGTDVETSHRVPAGKTISIWHVSVGLVEAFLLHAIHESMRHRHGETHGVLIVRAVPRFDHPDAFGVLADHRWAVSIGPGIKLFHLNLLEVELRVVDLDGVEPHVAHAISTAHLRTQLLQVVSSFIH